MKSLWVIAFVNIILALLIYFSFASVGILFGILDGMSFPIAFSVFVLVMFVSWILSNTICSVKILKKRLVYEELWGFSFITGLYNLILVQCFEFIEGGGADFEPAIFLTSLIGVLVLGTLFNAICIYLSNIIFKTGKKDKGAISSKSEVLDSDI